MYTGAEQCVITLNSFLSLILSCSSLSHDLSANKPQWNLQLNPPCFYLIHLTAAYRLLLQKPWVFPTSVACDLSTKKPTKSHVNKLNAKKKKNQYGFVQQYLLCSPFLLTHLISQLRFVLWLWRGATSYLPGFWFPLRVIIPLYFFWFMTYLHTFFPF